MNVGQGTRTHGLLVEPVTVRMSSVSVQSHGFVVLANVAVTPPRFASASDGEVGYLMPPRETPNVGRSTSPSTHAMLKKS